MSKRGKVTVLESAAMVKDAYSAVDQEPPEPKEDREPQDQLPAPSTAMCTPRASAALSVLLSRWCKLGVLPSLITDLPMVQPDE